MVINPLGLVAGATTFLGIWFGHVSVRKIEAHSIKLWQPMVIYLALGLIFELSAFFITNKVWAMVCGITGIILLWDVLEFKRQEQRVRKGHALPNPANSRHAAILTELVSTAAKSEYLGSQSRNAKDDPKITEQLDTIQKP